MIPMRTFMFNSNSGMIPAPGPVARTAPVQGDVPQPKDTLSSFNGVTPFPSAPSQPGQPTAQPDWRTTPASQIWSMYGGGMFSPSFRPPYVPGVYGQTQGGYAGFGSPQMTPVQSLQQVLRGLIGQYQAGSVGGVRGAFGNTLLSNFPGNTPPSR